ncbi:MAG: tetratricopeptide repeat protein [Acidobacteria bacterium]|nr:tetratricopeptide repeat protein [Acidobacteriota bacterium]
MKMRVLSLKSITVLMLSFVFAAAVSGQDLGSSNKLFGGSKPAPAKTKKAPPKPSAAKPKVKTTVRKPVSVKKRPAKPSTVVTAKKPAVKTETTPAVIAPKKTGSEPKVIIVGDEPKVVIGANSAANDEQYEELIELGNIERDERNYGGAELAYQKASRLKPRDARAFLGLGNLYSDQQRWSDAEKSYRSAVALEPDYVELIVALSFILTRPVAASNLSERYAEAEKLARRAIELNGRSALAADQLGVALELSGEIGSETENAYRRSIQLEPDFAPAHAHLARLLRKKGKTAASTASYNDAMARATDVGSKLLVADVMQSEGKYKESVQLLQQALAIDTRNPTALTMLGRAMTTQGNFADAERYLKKSVEVSPSGFISYSLLAALHARQGRLESAENYLIQAARFAGPFDKRLLATQFESVGDEFAKTGKASAAARVYRQAKTLDPDRESLAGKLAKYK